MTVIFMFHCEGQNHKTVSVEEGRGDYTWYYIHYHHQNDSCINPFTAQTCKISGTKDERTRLKNSMFSGLITNLFQCYAFLWKSFLKPLREEKRKKERLKDFKFRAFIGRFQVTSWQWRVKIVSNDESDFLRFISCQGQIHKTVSVEGGRGDYT